MISPCGLNQNSYSTSELMTGCSVRGVRAPISVINGNPLQPISAAETERYKLWVAEKNKVTKI